MKFLFWILVVLLVWWAWRRARGQRQRPPSPPPDTTAPPQTMCTCAHCGVHLPRSEAVQGQRGLYCSTAHRSAAGDQNPA